MKPEAATPSRREAILSAALACFNEKGIEATAVGEICDRANASIGSIYHHFGSKEGIVSALLAEGMRSNAADLERRLEKTTGAKQGIHAVVESLIRWIAGHPEWARFIYIVSSQNGKNNDQLKEVNAYYAGIIERYFRPYARAGEFHDIPEECLAPLVVGPVHDYARRWLNGMVTVAITEHINLFADAAWRAVSQSGESWRS